MCNEMWRHESCDAKSEMHGSSLLVALLCLATAAAAPALAAKNTTKSKKHPASASASASAGASRPASAAARAPTLTAEQEHYFRALDLDGDGRVSKAEAAGFADVVNGFDRADRSRDGQLSPVEFRALIKRREYLARREAARQAKLEARRQKAAQD